MIVSQIKIKNWRNFREANITLGDRVFIVGPNACGKSNFLDIFRFLRDIAKPGGGLQKAIQERQSFSKIRCLSARKEPNIEIEIYLSDFGSKDIIWKYAIGIKQENRGYRQPYLAYEKVWDKDNNLLVNRPNKDDEDDQIRLTQTYLEQINSNAQFRDIAKFLESVLYLHLVPQLLRYPLAFSGPELAGDPFGRNFIERLAKTPEKTRQSRLKKIEEGLRIAVPNLKKLNFIKDELGIPHLEAIYEHWRYIGAKQREDQFSDGTLRLIGLLWSMLESDSLLLLEEPELSLNAGIVKELPGLIYRFQKQKKRQIILSTHSADLLSNPEIGGEEVLLLTPTKDGTTIDLAASIPEVRSLLESGLSISDAVLPRTIPTNMEQLSLLK
jgi:predicted ATPase